MRLQLRLSRLAVFATSIVSHLHFLFSLYSSVTLFYTHFSYLPCTNHGYVWRYKERKGFRLLFPLPSFLCDVSGHWGHKCRSLSFSRNTCADKYHAKMAACRPAGVFIGHFPSLSSTPHARPARQMRQLASRQSRIVSRGKCTQKPSAPCITQLPLTS